MRPFGLFLCRHDFYWSERRGAERCRRCGVTRAAEERDEHPLAAFLAADNAPSVPTRPVVEPIIENWERNGPTGKREAVGLLRGRLERLVEGGTPTREEVIETVLALIEDGQSSDPVVFGPSAAEWSARLSGIR